jgi:hypothetical protein
MSLMEEEQWWHGRLRRLRLRAVGRWWYQRLADGLRVKAVHRWVREVHREPRL